MSDEPPFDDDELINDYYEEDVPEDYEDEYLDEIMEENQQVTNDAESKGENVQNMLKATDVPSPHPISSPSKKRIKVNHSEKNVEDIPMVNRYNESDQLNATDAPSTVIMPKSEILERDLYGFERYESSMNWRKETEVEQQVKDKTMQAVKWKMKTDIMQHPNMTSGHIQRSNAPESQLVNFAAFDYSSSDIFESKRYMIQSSSIPVENENNIPLTLPCGRRIFIKKSEKNIQQLMHKGNIEADRSLLGITMDELNQRAAAVDRKRDRTKKRMKVSHNDESAERIHVPSSKNAKSNRLWVDKHTPSHFSDLLSDERINREVLRALRQWDPFVFGKDAPVRQSHFQDDDKKDTIRAGENQTNDKRPDERNRVILLSGPPGVGKTTLAHIIAKHAGYRPLEVNASDERSATVLIDRVTRAMESSTLMTSSGNVLAGRPNCLILDEIDGADAKSSIKAILNIIRAEKTQKDAKKRGKALYLRRPIIFICNHKHVPALKPLLPFAKQFDVKAPLTSRLVSRLKSILASERMAIVGGNSLLHQLVEISGGDIRSCLYTLQFASARAREIAAYKRRNDDNFDPYISTVDITSTLAPVLGTQTGNKDERSDFTGTLASIFRKMKKGGKVYDDVIVRSNSHPRDVERIIESVDCFGDNSKTLDALFLNLLNVSYVDPTMDRCWTAHEWLSTVDTYRSFTSSVAMNNSSEHRTMQKFHLPTAAAAIHLLCRVETKSDLMYSMRQLLDTSYQLEANESLVDKFLEGLPPTVRSASQRKHLVSDVIPYCMWLLSAGKGKGALNRPVSSFDILSKEEKSSFEKHVAVLRSLGLTYVVSDNGDTVNNSMDTSMRLEPEVDKISMFKELKPKREEIPALLKELLAHATTVASIMGDTKEENMETGGNNNMIQTAQPESLVESNKPSRTKETSFTEQTTVKSNGNDAKSNFLGIGAAKAKAARSARKAADVGFDRSKNRNKLSNSGTGRPIDQVLRYKYQKGFTQAVRLPCCKEDLLL